MSSTLEKHPIYILKTASYVEKLCKCYLFILKINTSHAYQGRVLCTYKFLLFQVCMSNFLNKDFVCISTSVNGGFPFKEWEKGRKMAIRCHVRTSKTNLCWLWWSCSVFMCVYSVCMCVYSVGMCVYLENTRDCVSHMRVLSRRMPL